MLQFISTMLVTVVLVLIALTYLIYPPIWMNKTLMEESTIQNKYIRNSIEIGFFLFWIVLNIVFLIYLL